MICAAMMITPEDSHGQEKTHLGQEILATVELPEPDREGEAPLERVLQDRRSVRSFTGDPLELAEVSQMLWAAYGITKTWEGMPGFVRGGLKTAPSAGALYPLDLYLVAGNVNGLPDGVYLYVPDGHVLHRIIDGDMRPRLVEACLGQSFAGSAPASIVYSAVFERNTRKYGERGRERYVCMDLGHSGQNVYLQAEALGLGTCAIGAFTDGKVHETVGMTAKDRTDILEKPGCPGGWSAGLAHRAE